MNYSEKTVSFDCKGYRLHGVLHLPEEKNHTGVLIVVGGPQYRVGSHRQFVLLARYLAENNVAVMRFDYRGMGDSEGEERTFEGIDVDIRCAIDSFLTNVPSLDGVVIWGLCDAASAASYYANSDERVVGLSLLNPWVRTEAGIAKAYLKSYYLLRLVAPGFWKKVFGGKFELSKSLKSLFKMLGSARSASNKHNRKNIVAGDRKPNDQQSLPVRMLHGLKNFSGSVLVVLSGDDLTAEEFRGVVKQSREWRKVFARPNVQQHLLEEANHTFSRAEWRDQVAQWTLEWLCEVDRTRKIKN